MCGGSRMTGLPQLCGGASRPYTSLERETEERNDCRAVGLSRFTQNYQFVFTLHMMCDLLPHLSDLSKAMQMRDVIYTCIKPLVRGTLAVLRGLLTTPGEHYQAAPERERVARLRTEGFSIAVPIPEQIDQFTDKMYRLFVQQLLTSIEERFSDLPLLQLYEVLNATKIPTGDMGNHGEQDIRTLADHFNLPAGATVNNWQHVRGSLQGSGKKTDEAMEWVTVHPKTIHDHLSELAAVGLLLPTSTADCERGFSTMKRVKTENHASLKSSVLNALMMVSIVVTGPRVFSGSNAAIRGQTDTTTIDQRSTKTFKRPRVGNIDNDQFPTLDGDNQGREAEFTVDRVLGMTVYIDIDIYDTSVKAVADTAAMVTLMNDSLFRQIFGERDCSSKCILHGIGNDPVTGHLL